LRKRLKTDLKALGPEGVDWINLAEDRNGVAGCCEWGNEFRIPYDAGSLLTD